MPELWVEKYRPSELKDFIGNSEVKDKAEKMIGEKNIPHLLLSGKPGCGKTTLSILIAKNIFGEGWRNNFLEYNASHQRGIDFIRKNVKDAASFVAMDKGFKIIFLDEADGLTTDAQEAMRRIMEQYYENTRFIFACNNPQFIIPAIKSRCLNLELKRLGDEEIREKLIAIDFKEKCNKADKINEIVKQSQGDLRKAINALQFGGEKGNGMFNYEEFSQAVLENKVRLGLKMVEEYILNGEDERRWLEGYSDWLLPNSPFKNKTPIAFELISKYDYKLVMGATKTVQLRGFVCELAVKINNIN